jgi:hypothetical protein
MRTIRQRIFGIDTLAISRHLASRLMRWMVGMCAVLALAGCTVPVVGSTGVGLDSNGDLVGYLAVCEQHIDGVTMYIDDQSGPLHEGRNVGRWASSTPVTSAASWSLTGASRNWNTELAFSKLRPGQPYTMYGWTTDNSGSTADVTFTFEQLQTLKPGQVLYFGGYDERMDKDLQRVGSASDFSNFACGP